MKIFLLLSLLAFSIVAFGEVGKDAAAVFPANSAGALTNSRDLGRGESSGASDRAKATDEATSDRVCLKIRAFIFATNDDQVPKFVRETTCPPVRASAKKINQNSQPKLVPATGDTHF